MIVFFSCSNFFNLSIFLRSAVCGSSFDSYNSFGLNPIGYNSQASFNASNNSFNTNTASSLLLDQTYGNVSSVGSGNNVNGTVGTAAQSQSVAFASSATAPMPYNQSSPNTLNLPSTPLLPSYSTNSGSAGSPHAYANTPSPYDPSSIISAATEESYDNLIAAAAATANSSRQPSSIGDHQHLHQHQLSSGGTAAAAAAAKQQLDDQLMTKVSQMSLEQVTKLLAQKQRELHATSRIIRNQIASSTEIIVASGRDLRQDKEEFC